MEIRYQPNFTSKLSPIKPFSVNTKHGRVYIRELSQNELKKKGFIKNLTVMFAKNFASFTNNPEWLIINNPNEKEKAIYVIKNFTKYVKNKFLKPDDNLTLLAVFDKHKKLQGACMSFGFDEAPGCRKSTCYIESIGINKKYRGEGLGKILINKTISSAKKNFTDVLFLPKPLQPDKQRWYVNAAKQIDKINKNFQE